MKIKALIVDLILDPVSALVFVLVFVSTAQAQTPDHRGEVALDAPSYRGTNAFAPIPPEMHFRNEGGSNGAGICVITTLTINGQYQGIPALMKGRDSDLWQAAKRMPGGHSPDNLFPLLKRYVPGEPYVSYVGTDFTVVQEWIKSGRPVAITTNTGAIYRYQPIHHFVSTIHYEFQKLAGLVDSNDPGLYHWMPATEFERRAIDGSVFWAFMWLRFPRTAETPAEVMVFGATLVLLTTYLCLPKV